MIRGPQLGRFLAAGLLIALAISYIPETTHSAESPLQVIRKTATSVTLDWRGWPVPNLNQLTIYRNGKPIITFQQARTSFVDTTTGWGETFAYFVRARFNNGTTADTNTVWVTTNALSTGLNVILVLTDDQRWDTLQYMPRVQQLLVQPGVTFSNAFASTPQCCPSRAGLLTGLFSHNHGVLSNRINARGLKDASTLATWLRGAGYRTALIGKYLNGYSEDWKLFRPWPYTPPGWSDWHAFRTEGYYDYRLVENGSEVTYGTGPEDYSTLVLASKAVDFITTTPVGQPFFLLFTPRAPHIPAISERRDKVLFVDLSPWRPPSFNEADVADKPAWVQLLPPLTADDAARVERRRIKQLRSLQSVDRAVQAIYDAVAASGRLDSTVFILTSDNGWAWGEHRMARGKICPYDECARVPLVVRVPGASPRVDAHLITLIDLVPSIASWTGIPHPKVDGTSIARLVFEPNTSWRDAMLIEMLDGESDEQAMLYSAVRTRTQLYVEYLNGDREFYDLKTDPFALLNAVADPVSASLIERLRTRLEAFRRQ
ncbi:MAG TPA: sulfatase [bacterium]|jgi:arylsulfatase A-like enzyme